MSGPNDYGVSGDYLACDWCGTKRPTAALVSLRDLPTMEGGRTDLHGCADRDWCKSASAEARQAALLLLTGAILDAEAKRHANAQEAAGEATGVDGGVWVFRPRKSRKRPVPAARRDSGGSVRSAKRGRKS